MLPPLLVAAGLHHVQLPGILHSAAPLLDSYGYLAVFGFIFLEDFGTPFVPGETVLIAGAVYAGAGRLNVVLVGLLAFVAAVLGDNVGFAIGRFAGHEAVVRWGRYVLLTEQRVARAEALFKRQGPKVVAIARFIDVLRQLNGIVAGIAEMRWRTFLFFNALGAAAWVGCWVAVGYTAGGHIEAIYRWFTRSAVLVLVVGVVAVVAIAARHVLRRRRELGGRAGEAKAGGTRSGEPGTTGAAAGQAGTGGSSEAERPSSSRV